VEIDHYELHNGLTVPLSGDLGDFVEAFANALLGEVVVSAHGQVADWRALTDLVQEAVATELAHFQSTASPELRGALLSYLMRACVIDTYQGLLDEAYPGWRAEAAVPTPED
jgi:hypothetical protein